MIQASQFRHLVPEDIEQCLGCANEFFLQDMNPMGDAGWVCKPCFRAELEAIE
jgi:hypothetical protein